MNFTDFRGRNLAVKTAYTEACLFMTFIKFLCMNLVANTAYNMDHLRLLLSSELGIGLLKLLTI